MGIIKIIKNSTLVSSIVFLGATIGTVGIVSGTALAKPKPPKTPPSVNVVVVYSPVNENNATVTTTTVQSGSTGSVFYSANSLFGNTSNKGDLTTGNVTNTNTTTVTLTQSN